MQKQAEYLAGWIATSIHDFLSEIEEPSSSMSYALITCLDSCFDVPTLLNKSAPLANLKEKSKRVGGGIVVSTRLLLAAERQTRIFFGFDEVWFFPHADIKAKPKGLVLAGLDKSQPGAVNRFVTWMHGNGCSLGLGDGTGMNFCLKARGAARYIVRAFNESTAGEQVASEEADAQFLS